MAKNNAEQLNMWIHEDTTCGSPFFKKIFRHIMKNVKVLFPNLKRYTLHVFI